MKHLQALSHLVLLLVVAASSLSNASILEDACKSLAANSPSIDYAYCIRFFQADKGSATADKSGLAIIAAKITKAAAESTGKRIDALKSSEKDQKMVGCLSDCADLYSNAVDQLDEAAKGIGSGNPGGLQDAMSNLSAALDAPGTCEDGFRELGEKSPVAAEDSEFTKEASIALVVTKSLQSSNSSDQ